MTREQKARIDKMTHYELAYMWACSPIGHELMKGECGIYLASRLKEAGGFTPEIARRLGWGN